MQKAKVKPKEGRASKSRKGEWVGHGAKRFTNAAKWPYVYAVMGSFAFLLTAPANYNLLRSLDGLSPWSSYHWSLLFVVVGQQLFQACVTAIFTRQWSVYVGQNGIELWWCGQLAGRYEWNQIERVELRRVLGIVCVRLVLAGDAKSGYLPFSGKVARAILSEAREWLGGQTALTAPADVDCNAQTPLPAMPTVRETQEEYPAVRNLRA